jgi:hypothetical protein
MNKFSHWDYRVINNSLHAFYNIHEVYYDENGKVMGISENPVSPMSESISELIDILEQYKSAIEKPILFCDEFMNLIR